MLFDACEGLQEILKAADNDFTYRKILEKGLHIICNTNDFSTDLQDWGNLPARFKR